MKHLLLFSHGHPDITVGGAEIATYNLFRAINASSDCGWKATFVARTTASTVTGQSLRIHRERPHEWLWETTGYDAYRSINRQSDSLKRGLDQIFSMTSPDAVHIGHYAGIGVEIFDFCAAEGLPIVLTLHEYMAICANRGQMYNHARRRCNTAIHAVCAVCMPRKSSGKSFLRENLIKRSLGNVDHFISPSRFLADRYTEWGLDRDRLSVIENLLPRYSPVSEDRPPRSSDEPFRFGFFGQLSVAKGFPLLMEAMAILAERDRRPQIELHVFGVNLDLQPNADKVRLNAAIEKAGDMIVMNGRYENRRSIALMRGVDWIVVPSVWWENSPVVLQEARIAGVPALVSDIGGMAEKVTPNRHGAHFMAGSSQDLASTMIAIAESRSTIDLEPLNPGTANGERLEAHIDLYDRVVAANTQGAAR